VMTVERDVEDGTHRCLNGHRCADKVDKKARITEAANTFCAVCLRKSARNVSQLPEQFLRLRHMIGDRHAGVDVNIRRPKPGGNVPLNLHIDTMLGSILTDLTTAAEVVADRMEMGDPTEVRQKQPVQAPVWADDPKQEAAEQVHRCARIVAPNLPVLIGARGVGGREDDDPAIDVMDWAPNGLIHMPSTTTGTELVKRLDHLASLAFFTLGLSRARTERDTPCSRCRAKTVGRWAGSETFDCSSCGSRFPEDELRQQDKILIELVKRGLIKPERETA
jgi:hypothetical protein